MIWVSPTLFNIYINELAKSLKESNIPGLTLSTMEVKCLLFADDLILLTPSKEALQKQLDHLQKFCWTWALTIKLEKTKIMVNINDLKFRKINIGSTWTLRT